MITWDKAANQGYVKCIIDGCNGVSSDALQWQRCIPQYFIKHFSVDNEVSKDDRETLEYGPDAEHYWEAWETVLDEAYWIDGNGNEWRLFQDGDLYAYRSDIDIDLGWETL